MASQAPQAQQQQPPLPVLRQRQGVGLEEMMMVEGENPPSVPPPPQDMQDELDEILEAVSTSEEEEEDESMEIDEGGQGREGQRRKIRSHQEEEEEGSAGSSPKRRKTIEGEEEGPSGAQQEEIAGGPSTGVPAPRMFRAEDEEEEEISLRVPTMPPASGVGGDQPPPVRDPFVGYQELLFRHPLYEQEGGEGQGQLRFRPVDQEGQDGGVPNPEEELRRRREREPSTAPPPQKQPQLTESRRMLLARKLFFMTADLIFPGFSLSVEGKMDDKYKKQYRAVRVRSSWSLQAILYAEALFFTMWVLAFISTVDISISVLKELHGNLVLCMSLLFTLVNIPRLFFGLRGNEGDKLEFLALFWMTTFVVQLPLLGFILFTDVFTPIRLAFTIAMDSAMILLIFLEFTLVSFHLKNLVRDELKIIKMAKLINETNQEEEGEGGEVIIHPHQLARPFPPQEVEDNNNLLLRGQRGEDDDEDDGNWSTDNENEDDGVVRDQPSASLRYRMQLEGGARGGGNEEIEDDDEDDEVEEDHNIVTSSSDPAVGVRRRPVVVPVN